MNAVFAVLPHLATVPNMFHATDRRRLAAGSGSVLHARFGGEVHVFNKKLEGSRMTKLLSILFVLCVSLSAHARNPGESASSCVNARSGSNGTVVFKNNCSEKVFVIYCGDLKYSKKRCGDGPKGGFYTHSTNIDVGSQQEAQVNGRYQYAACKGSISFGNDGEYEDSSDGSYRCLKR